SLGFIACVITLFLQEEDGIRYRNVTGVQTCALPICNCIVLPYTATAEEILNLNPDGVLLSNGPGNPEEMLTAAKMVQEVEKHVPLFGICMGHQVFALANGASTYKMKFGHSGFNHPVREIATGNIGCTSQNHG